MNDQETRATKIHELSQTLSGLNGALSGIDSILDSQTLFALEALCAAIHRTAALVIEIAQEQLDGVHHGSCGNDAATHGPPVAGDPPRVRTPRRRK